MFDTSKPKIKNQLFIDIITSLCQKQTKKKPIAVNVIKIHFAQNYKNQ